MRINFKNKETVLVRINFKKTRRLLVRITLKIRRLLHAMSMRLVMLFIFK